MGTSSSPSMVRVTRYSVGANVSIANECLDSLHEVQHLSFFFNFIFRQ